jgi:hypothetical protein
MNNPILLVNYYFFFSFVFTDLEMVSFIQLEVNFATYFYQYFQVD